MLECTMDFRTTHRTEKNSHVQAYYRPSARQCGNYLYDLAFFCPRSGTHDMRGSTCIASLNLFMGYWQITLQENSQAVHAFMAHDGVYAPSRNFRVAINSGSHFHAQFEPLFAKLRKNYKAYIDEFSYITRRKIVY